MTNSDPAFDEFLPKSWTAYQSVAHIHGSDSDQQAYVGVRRAGFDIYLRGGIILHYDLEGRLVRAANPPLQWRRGLSQQMVQLRRLRADEGTGFEAQMLETTTADALLDQFSKLVQPLTAAISSGKFTVEHAANMNAWESTDFARLISRAAAFDAAQAHADYDAFRALYGSVPILPPDQYNALALMATDGCRYNRCTFCDFYRSVPFRRKTPREFAHHVDAAIQYHGAGLASRRTIFLGQANALAGDASWREAMFQVVNCSFEFPAAASGRVEPNWWCGSTRRFVGITSFLDAFSGVAPSADEFARLRQLHLTCIYIGMESGAPDLLDWLQKPGTPEQILKTVRAAKQGGVQVGVIVLLGAGGDRFAQQHVAQTIELIRAMQLQKGDYVYLSPLITAGRTDYEQRLRRDNIKPLTPLEVLAQEHAIRSGIEASAARSGGPYIARYDVAQFVY